MDIPTGRSAEPTAAVAASHGRCRLGVRRRPSARPPALSLVWLVVQALPEYRGGRVSTPPSEVRDRSSGLEGARLGRRRPPSRGGSRAGHVVAQPYPREAWSCRCRVVLLSHPSARRYHRPDAARLSPSEKLTVPGEGPTFANDALSRRSGSPLAGTSAALTESVFRVCRVGEPPRPCGHFRSDDDQRLPVRSSWPAGFLERH